MVAPGPRQVGCQEKGVSTPQSHASDWELPWLATLRGLKPRRLG